MAKKMSKEEFVFKAKQIHGDKYDYSKAEYLNNHTKVCIICPVHGEFWQTPNMHLLGQGCKKCGIIKSHKPFTKNAEQFIKEARAIHGDKYDYSKVEYKNNHIKICIICPIHGEFWETPKHHLHGHGCPFCSNRFGYTTETFTDAAKIIHGNKYDYSKVKYIDCYTKVCIICNKKDENGVEHGEFLQAPYNHLQGQGCPICNESKLEKELRTYFNLLEIEYDKFKRFDWLNPQNLDFYLPKYNIAIECQGIQHYKPISFTSDKSEKTVGKNFEIITTRDQRKKQLCEEHGVKLLYFTHYKDIEETENLFKNKENILSFINENNLTR